jgi:hypothetical protein
MSECIITENPYRHSERYVKSENMRLLPFGAAENIVWVRRISRGIRQGGADKEKVC